MKFKKIVSTNNTCMRYEMNDSIRRFKTSINKRKDNRRLLWLCKFQEKPISTPLSTNNVQMKHSARMGKET